jgi:hypothetical protein
VVGQHRESLLSRALIFLIDGEVEGLLVGLHPLGDCLLGGEESEGVDALLAAREGLHKVHFGV